MPPGGDLEYRQDRNPDYLFWGTTKSSQDVIVLQRHRKYPAAMETYSGHLINNVKQEGIGMGLTEGFLRSQADPTSFNDACSFIGFLISPGLQTYKPQLSSSREPLHGA